MSTLNYLGRREEGPHLLMGPIQGCGGFLPQLQPSPSSYELAMSAARARRVAKSLRPSGGSKFRARAKRRVDHRLARKGSSGLLMVGVGPSR